MPSSRTTMPFSFRASRCPKSACADGYVGVMCMDCSSNFYAAGRACKECQDYDLEFPSPWLFAPRHRDSGCCPGSLAMEAEKTQNQRCSRYVCKSSFTEFKAQIQAEGPILLQHCRWAMSTLSFCVLHFSDHFYTISFNLEIFFVDFIFLSKLQGQLWAVLAALRKTTDASSSWEIPYIETLQFSLSSLKGALNLQCKFDAWPWNA